MEDSTIRRWLDGIPEAVRLGDTQVYIQINVLSCFLLGTESVHSVFGGAVHEIAKVESNRSFFVLPYLSREEKRINTAISIIPLLLSQNPIYWQASVPFWIQMGSV